MAANTEKLWRHDKACLTKRVYTRERRAGPNPLLNNHRLTSQTHYWCSLSPSTGQVNSEAQCPGSTKKGVR